MAEVLTEGLGWSWWALGTQGCIPWAPGLHEPPLHKELPALAGEGRDGEGSQSFACFRGLSLDGLAGPSTESRNF